MTEQTEQVVVEKEVLLYHGASASLERYGEAEVVRARALRNMALDTRPTKLTVIEHFALAQVELYYDLDSTLGEIQAWADGEGEKRKFTMMRGTSGKWRTACENALRAGTRLEEPRYRQLVDTAERALNHVQEGDLAIEAEVWDYVGMQDWYQRRTILKAEGKAGAEIDRIVGEQPIARGLGILAAEDIESRNWYHTRKQIERNDGRGMVWVEDNRLEARTGRKPVKYNDVALASKRARDAAISSRWLNQGRGTRPAIGAGQIDVSKYTIEAEWREVMDARSPRPAAPQSPRQAQATQAQGKRAGDALFEDASKQRSWEPAVVQGALKAKLAESSFQAIGRLKLSPFVNVEEGKLTFEEVKAWLSIYQRIRTASKAEGHKLESVAVANMATEEWELQGEGAANHAFPEGVKP